VLCLCYPLHTFCIAWILLGKSMKYIPVNDMDDLNELAQYIGMAINSFYNMVEKQGKEQKQLLEEILNKLDGMQ